MGEIAPRETKKINPYRLYFVQNFFSQFRPPLRLLQLFGLLFKHVCLHLQPTEPPIPVHLLITAFSLQAENRKLPLSSTGRCRLQVNQAHHHWNWWGFIFFMGSVEGCHSNQMCKSLKRWGCWWRGGEVFLSKTNTGKKMRNKLQKQLHLQRLSLISTMKQKKWELPPNPE